MPTSAYNYTTAALRGMFPDVLGDFFFVHSSGNSNGGKSSQNPCSTLGGAFDISGLASGDCIVILPGHTENISAATSCVMDVAGVRVVGLGSGSSRPTLVYTATAGTVELDAANLLIENIVFKSSISAVVVGINVDAANITMKNCEMTWDETGDDFVTMIDCDAVNGFTLDSCKLIAEDTAGCAEAIRLDDTDNTTIKNCHIYGDFTDGAIIGEGASGTNLVIKENTIYNSDTTAGFVIDLNVAFTGILAYNACGTLYATDPESTLDPGSLLCIENYVVNAVDETGTIVPVTAST